MKITRRKTKPVKIGNIYIGGSYPVAIQSMTKTQTADTEKTLKQIKELEHAGCEIVRLAVENMQDAKALKKIKAKAKIPIVADIHFNWRLAIEAIDSGADKIRLNPGNIDKQDEIKEIARAAKLARIPIRVGVNSGSLRLKTTPDNMVKSALDYIKLLEGFKFYDLVVSLKGSDILDTIEAYQKVSGVCDYPLHLGVTATGPSYSGTIKSSIAMGVLLSEGIGDTIRVSLTDDPQQEIKVAKALLESLGLRYFGPEIISCPTCGRCEVDLIKIVKEFENKLSTVNCKLSTVNSRPLRVAIMGCVVNGPGEASGVDLGVAFGKKQGLLFKQGKPIKKISPARCVEALLKELCSGQRHSYLH